MKTRMSPARRRYAFRLAASMAGYVITLALAITFVRDGGISGPLAWLLALLPGLCVASVFWAFGRLLVEETDEEPGATPDVPSTPDVELPEGEKITVYVQFPADWKTPAVWAWKEPGPVNATDAAWPGDLFLVKGDNGWWSVQVPNWITGLLINGNGGTVQTPDIKDFEVGKDLWINALTDPQNPVLSYEPIDVAPPAETEAPTPPVRETEGLKDNAPKNEESKGGKDLTVILAIAGAAAIIVVAVVIIVIGKGKKKA